jgi:GT2 family glycosyltransferase
MHAESSPAIALIIPVGPGDASWHALLPFLATLPAEIEICFSGCQPRPTDGRLAPHWRWLEGPPGRARQLNLGSRQTTAAWLWWLHADSRPRADALSALRASIAAAPAALHWFPLAFTDGPWLTRLNAHGANWRSRVLGLPFGDQGLCLARADYLQLGGFDEQLARGEDLDLVIRARHAGIALAQVASPLTSSARRYRQQGWLRTTAEHLWLTWRQTRAARRRCDSD